MSEPSLSSITGPERSSFRDLGVILFFALVFCGFEALWVLI